MMRKIQMLREIFVFGSNTQGRHGKGSALEAVNKYGASYGQSKGLQGNSYAICTKDLTKKIHPSISKEDIEKQIKELYFFASNHTGMIFKVCYTMAPNLNGYD